MDTSPKNKIFFCSTASKYYHEMLAGSAANYKSFILVEYNKPFPEKVLQARLDKLWLNDLHLLAKQRKGKVLLIKNQNSSVEMSRVVFVDCENRKYCEIKTSFQNLKEVNLRNTIEASSTLWENKPFFLVCTNGKKDKCCSKFGLPVFKFFEGILEQTDVWECSHIGGDRFAANAIYLPFGIYYGRITVEDVPEIIDQCLQHKIHLPNYRGLSTLSFYHQAIEFYLRQHLHNQQINFPIKIKTIKQEQNEITAHAFSAEGNFELHVTRQVILYPHYLTCKSHKRENVVKYLLNSIKRV